MTLRFVPVPYPVIVRLSLGFVTASHRFAETLVRRLMGLLKR